MRRWITRCLWAVVLGGAMPAGLLAQAEPVAKPGKTAQVVVNADPYRAATSYNATVVGRPVPASYWNMPNYTLGCDIPNQNTAAYVYQECCGCGFGRGCGSGCDSGCGSLFGNRFGGCGNGCDSGCNTSCGNSCGSLFSGWKLGNSCGSSCNTGCSTPCTSSCNTSCGNSCGSLFSGWKLGNSCGSSCNTGCSTPCTSSCNTSCGNSCGSLFSGWKLGNSCGSSCNTGCSTPCQPACNTGCHHVKSSCNSCESGCANVFGTKFRYRSNDCGSCNTGCNSCDSGCGSLFSGWRDRFSFGCKKDSCNDCCNQGQRNWFRWNGGCGNDCGCSSPCGSSPCGTVTPSTSPTPVPVQPKTMPSTAKPVSYIEPVGFWSFVDNCKAKKERADERENGCLNCPVHGPTPKHVLPRPSTLGCTGCSTLESESVFLFGSCRQFFGEPTWGWMHGKQ